MGVLVLNKKRLPSVPSKFIQKFDTRFDPTFSRDQRDEMRREMRCWLHSRSQGYTHFVTLSTNDPMKNDEASYGLLRAWDARVNRALLGPKWQKRPDERIVWFACLEGLDSACHWHLLFRLSWNMPEEKKIKRPTKNLITTLDITWRRITSRGSTKTLLIEDAGAYDYVTKRLNKLEYISTFVDSLSFKL